MSHDGSKALHNALSQPGCSPRDVEELLSAAIDDSERATMLRSRNRKDMTPLMVAAASGGGFGCESSTRMAGVCRVLLEHGAGVTVAAKGKTRLTAADYALRHGKRRLAAELRELEQAWLLANSHRTASIAPSGESAGTTNATPGPSTTASAVGPSVAKRYCAICGDRLGQPKFKVAEAAVRRGELDNHLIRDFFGDGRTGTGSEEGERGRKLEALCHPLLHHVNQRHGFTREFTEALAMVARLEAAVEAGKGDDDGLGEPWHVVDLCCGKGFLAALVATTFPTFHVTAIDRLSSAFQPHFSETGIRNVGYAQLDLMAPEFLDELASVISKAGGRRTAILGMHLCGLLSLRAMDAMATLPEVCVLVLAPCCLPNKRAAEDTPSSVFEGEGKMEKYARWCDFLHARMRATKILKCKQEVEGGILSERRTLLTATKDTIREWNRSTTH